MKIKSILSASLGGAFEWYDFIIYGFFIQFFGHQFFPKSNAESEQIIAFSIFAIGFLARPIGGLVFGHIGDVYGRTRSLYYSMILIGIATLCIALMPTYRQIGNFSVTIFIFLRICQGFAIGGSISGSFVYISELSKPETRSFWVSTAFIGTMRGIIFASIIINILMGFLSHEQLHIWGWRIAFLLGALILLLAHHANRLMIETPYHEDLVKNQQVAVAPISTLFKKYKLIILQCLGITTIHAVLTLFILLFMPAFLQHYGMTHDDALRVNLITIIVFSTILPFFGWLGNKLNLQTMLVTGCVLLIIFITPILHMIANHDIWARSLGILLITILNSMVSASLPPIIVGLFPTEIRYCGVSFAYNLCIALCAGISPLVIFFGHKVGSLTSAIIPCIIITAIISIISTILPRVRHLPVSKKHFDFSG
ncbi:MAG: ral substrate transporter [Burkholderiales bacterium]|jgi:MHS family proline/betaine transporter-like MFS transporter|nr:ral substrate transporter [Burkholderiales bacterium]